jgi:signal transduction histidine kinase/CheY-like chemotaxis protein
MQVKSIPSWLPAPLLVLGVAAIYYGSAHLGLLVAFQKTNASPVWPPSGIAFAAVLLLGYRIWPGIAIGAFLANLVVFLGNQAAEPAALVGLSLWIAAGNTLEAVCGAALLRRLGVVDGPFQRARSVFRFLIAALLMCLVSSIVGVIGLATAGLIPWALYGQVWITWWLGDVAGILILTPVLLTLFARSVRTHKPRSLVESALLFAALVAVGQLTFEYWFPENLIRSQVYLLIPFLLWSAFRYSLRQVTLAILTVSGIATWATVNGSGPFFIEDSLNMSLLLLQSFVCTIAVTMLSLVSVLVERRRTGEELQVINETLEQRVAERTSELARANTELQNEIVERKNAEDQLRESQRMEAVGQLAAGVAHNFNNLLQGIIGSLDVALALPRADIRPNLIDAQETSLRAADIIKQLLLFTRTARPLEASPVDVKGLLSETVEMCRKRFDRKIDMALHTPESLPAIMGDAAQLQQVFLNLCLNANDALEGVAEPFIRVVASSPNGAGSSPDQGITIRVSDNGVGMDEEVQRQVFEPFFTTKDVDKGTGLGLATAFGIVQNHDGSIECESTIGVGTTFTVHLPTAESDVVPEAEGVVEEIPRGTETLLLIDDEEVTRKSLSAYLSGQGYRILLGKDGRDGLNVYEQHEKEIALVLLDLSMPQMTGQEVLRALRDLNPNQKVISLPDTARTQRSLRTLCR